MNRLVVFAMTVLASFGALATEYDNCAVEIGGEGLATSIQQLSSGGYESTLLVNYAGRRIRFSRISVYQHGPDGHSLKIRAANVLARFELDAVNRKDRYCNGEIGGDCYQIRHLSAALSPTQGRPGRQWTARRGKLDCWNG